MEPYNTRLAEPVIRAALDTFGAVILQGPRGVGKTTTGTHLARSWVRLDESPEILSLAEVAPRSILTGAVPRLIDEWQLAPTIWNAVRHEVDQRALPGQFILTGSAVPADDQTRHSGAGRFRRITMRPMCLLESGDTAGGISMDTFFSGGDIAGLGGPTVEDYARMIARGGWPALVKSPRRKPAEYLTSYLDDIARVDLPGTETTVDPVRMGALLRAIARNVATEIPATRLAAEAGIALQEKTLTSTTVRKYLDALTRIFVLEEQPAWATHLRANVRQRVSPKWHFIDPSLAAAAIGATPAGLMQDLNTLGLLFESLCVRDLRIHLQGLNGQLYHYRDETGLEVDAIAELPDGQWAAFEIKLGGQRAIEQAAASLKKLRGKVAPERAERLRSLNILTAGTTSFPRPDGVNVVSLGHLGRWNEERS